MKRIHLLRVEGEPASYAALIDAVRGDGGRVGWLDLGGAEPAPPALERAAALGVLRAVSVGPERTVAVKPRLGKTVMRDLLREHFRGCRLVLVSGPVDSPLVLPDGGEWVLSSGEYRWRHTTGSLVEALRKPRPWPEPEPEPG